MEKVILVAVVLFALMSCRGTRAVATHSNTQDSTVLERVITVRDTVYYSPAASVADTFFSPCPEGLSNGLPEGLGRQRQERQRTVKQATVRTKVMGNDIVVECECDTVAIRTQVKELYEKEFRQRTSQSKDQVIVKERYMPFWAKFFIASGVVFWFLLILKLRIKN